MGITFGSPKQRDCSELIIPHLPDEVIEQILSRIPVKSLLRFCSVSKLWNHTISYNPQFSKLHILNSNQDNDHSKIMILDGAGKFKHCSIHNLSNQSVTDATVIENFSLPYSEELYWVGSCNGLVCLSPDKNDLILWNPSTRKSNKLPPSGITSNTCRIYGFGYDQSCDDYKVVGFSYNMQENQYSGFVVKVFSLKTGEWKTIKNHMSCWRTNFPALFANGKIHWTMKPNVDKDAEEGSLGYHVPWTNELIWTPKWDVAYLDLETEEYGIIHKPDFVEGGHFWSFTVSQGCIYVFCQQSCRTNLWKIEGSYDLGNFTWNKLVSIPHWYGFMWCNHKTLLRVLNDREILFLCDPKLVIFNIKDYSFRCLSFRYPKIQNSDGVIMAGTYMESLVSPLEVGVRVEVEEEGRGWT